MNTLPYELHLTTHPLPAAAEQAFCDLCRSEGGKTLLIELGRGARTIQPMFSKIIMAAAPEMVLELAGAYAAAFGAHAFPIERIKIEVPAFAAEQVNAINGFRPYFEWHGKIAYERLQELETLCTAHEVHLSRNALKGESATRFLTLREYGGAGTFGKRLEALKNALSRDGRPCTKEQSEYCIYDNNQLLDQGWLS